MTKFSRWPKMTAVKMAEFSDLTDAQNPNTIMNEFWNVYIY